MVTVIEHRWSPDIGPASTRQHQPEPASSLTRDRLALGVGQRGCDVRLTPTSGRRQRGWSCPLSADTVEKVENRGAPKISRMSNVGDPSRCKALQNQYGRR
jgi:hypothetical protein